MANPYGIDQLVDSPEMLYGRQTQIRRLLRHAEQLDCVSVVGLPGMGKSSLLYHLAQQEKLKASHTTFYVQLSDPTLRDEADFVARAFDEVGRQTGRVLTGSVLRQLEGGLTVLRDQERRPLVCCLDGWGEPGVGPWADSTLMDELARLGFGRLVSLVVALPRPPGELLGEGGLSRMAARVFDGQIDLGLLPAQEADRLIREPALRQGLALPTEAIDLARQWAGRYPLYVQLAGYVLFQQVVEAGSEDWSSAQERFAEAAFPHFHQVWHLLGEEEREACRYYAGVPEVRPPGVDVRQRLLRKGILERRAEGYHLFSAHIEEVVRRRRADLERPLSVPQAVAAAELAPSEVVVSPPDGEPAPAEAMVPSLETGTDAKEASPEAARPPDAAGPPAASLPEASPEESSSLGMLGCYVIALMVDLLFIGGIVLVRTVARISGPQMAALIALAVVLPVLLLLVNRVNATWSIRLLAWILRRLEGQ